MEMLIPGAGIRFPLRCDLPSFRHRMTAHYNVSNFNPDTYNSDFGIRRIEESILLVCRPAFVAYPSRWRTPAVCARSGCGWIQTTEEWSQGPDLSFPPRGAESGSTKSGLMNCLPAIEMEMRSVCRIKGKR